MTSYATMPSSATTIPKYIGGPFDGGYGPVEPAAHTADSILLAGGEYELEFFELAATPGAPDRAVYRWRAA